MHSETNLQLIQILEKTISQDKNELETAEKFLVHAAATDLAQFIKMLSEVLAQGGNSQVARMAAGLQLKNHLTSKDASLKLSYQQRWLTFPDQIRFYIKKNIFATLGTENSRPSSAAQCVAYVAVAELPVGQWNDLIAQLVDNIVNPQSTEMQKEASLEAIGYICQDIDSEVLVEQCNQILTAIIHGMRSSEPSNYVRLAATMALHNSLEFTKANFDKENERNFIMEVVCEATQSGDVRISVAALQCLVKILSLYYHFMEPYMAQALFPITLEAMKSEIDEVALQGIEFWSNVSDEEIDLGIEESEAMETGCPPVRTSRHYAKGALQFLTPVLIHKLTKQEDAADEWNPCKAASVCLMLLANCCEDEILPYVLPFVEEHIKSEDWRFRDAALMALGNILGGLQTETAKPLAERAMPVLIELAYDPNVNVRDTTTWTLGRICEVVPEAVLNESYFKPLLECLVHGLSAEPQVAANVCWVFSGLAEAAYEAAKVAGDTSTPDTYLMSDCFGFIVERLLQNTDRSDASQNNLRSSAYEALMEMVKHSPKDCYGTVQQATVVVLDRLQQVLQAEKQASAHGERSHFDELLGLLCATLQSLLVKVTPEDAPQISDTVMGAVLTILGSNGGKADGVQEEAMLVVSGLVEVLQDGFLKYMDVFKAYLYMGLKNHRDHQVCEMTVGLVSDICRALKTRVLPYCDDLMTLLLENLQDGSIRRSVKPPVFSVFGDIAMNIGREFRKYLDVVMKMLFQASQVPMDRSDADTAAHHNKLRESVIEAYTGIVQGFKEDRPYGEARSELGVLEQYVTEIVNFVVIVGADPERTDGQAAALAGLIGDLCSFGPSVLPLLEVKPVADVLTAGRRSQVARTKITANWATKEMRKLKNLTTQVPASWVHERSPPGLSDS